MATSLTSIMNRPSSGAALENHTNKIQPKIRANSQKILTQENYTSLGELQGDGSLSRLNECRAEIIQVKQCDNNCKAMHLDINQQTQLMADIRSEVTRFRGEITTCKVSSPLTRKQMADKFFDNMELLLNRKRGDGNYILNPNNPKEAPVVEGGLKKISNIINGKVTSNYTKTEANHDTIEVSSSAFVRKSQMHAGSEFVMQALAMANEFKVNGSKNNIAYDKCQSCEEEFFGQMSVKIGLDKKLIEESQVINSTQEARASEAASDLLAVNLPKVTSELSDFINSLMASFAITTKMNQVQSQMLDRGLAAAG